MLNWSPAAIRNCSILNSEFFIQLRNIKGTADSCPPFLLFAVEAGDLRYYKQSVHTTPLPAGEGLGVGLLHIIKLRKHLYAVLMVAHAACLATTVHSEDGVAHVYTTQWD